MKRIILAFDFQQRFAKSWSLAVVILMMGNLLLAQAPQGIPYQAIMRNADGTVMASNALSLTFMIHDGAVTGNVVFQESHSLTSNPQGLVTCVVGNGVVSQGNFENINWGSGAKFLHVMMGSTDLGTQQLLSVPYALYSNGVNVNVSPTGDTLTIGNQTVIVPGISAANANNNTLPTSGLGAVVLPGNNTCADQFINVVGCNGQTSLTYDGRTYDLVEIGGQCWFADNLATDQYRNGDAIPTGLDNATWSTTTSGAYSIYNNDPANDVTYGKLYNWFTTVDSRGLCPTGWHVPTDCEWMYLEGSLGMTIDQQILGGAYRGNDEGGALKSTIIWNNPNINSTNSTQFNGLPGGDRYGIGSYNYILYYGYWWTATEDLPNRSWSRSLGYDFSSIYRNNDIKQDGMSIRCLKDSEAPVLQGCTDGSACNFLANATQDDGSCLYQNATCDDGNVNTVNDVINGECVCGGIALGNAAQLLPGNTTCQFQNISVTGCGGQTSLTYDGRTYDLVEIGGQCWFADNLATDQYRNGDPIATGLDFTEWQNTTQGSYSFYDNNLTLEALYGKLYNWYAVQDNRGLCPIGWHVPSDCEWMYLESNLGLANDLLELEGWRGTNQGGALKSTINWDLPNTGATNSSGFTALPGGFRSIDQYSNGGNFAIFWAQNNFNELNSFVRVLYFVNADIYRGYQENWFGHSVRCLKD